MLRRVHLKTSLYRKFVKAACRDLEVSRKQLFAREFRECVFPVYRMTDFQTRKIERDASRLVVLQKRTPLSQMYDAVDMHRRWVSKHWRKLSRHRAFIQVNVDLGMPEHKAVEAYFEAEARKKEKAKHGIHA